MKADWVTLLAILIIFTVAVWSYMTVDSRIKDSVEECNEHWRIQVERTCPALIQQNLYDIRFEINSTTGA